MASHKVMEERVKMLVAKLRADEEAAEWDSQRANIHDIEDAMVRIGDLVASEFGMQKLARHTG